MQQSTPLGSKRVYLGGLASSVTEEDIRDRFKSFGQVSDINIPLDLSGQSRGFAHFNFITEESQWKRLVSAYNGSNWRGSKIKVEEAKKDYLSKLQEECSTDSIPSERIRKRIRMASNQTLMTDDQIGKRKGWKRGRYGRATLVVHIKRSDGKMLTVDPAHYKDNVTKLFGSVKPLPLSKLTWTWTNENTIDDEEEGMSGDEGVNMDGDSDRDEEVGRNEETDKNEGTSRNEESGKNEGMDKDDDRFEKSEDGLQEKSKKNDKDPNDQLHGDSTPKEYETVEFSLSRLFGLESSVQVPSEILIPSKTTDQTPTPTLTQSSPPPSLATIPKSPIILKNLIFDFNRIEEMSLKDIAFCRRSGKEEAYAIWKSKRSELRRDFKQRLKQAKKLARRKTLR